MKEKKGKEMKRFLNEEGKQKKANYTQPEKTLFISFFRLLLLYGVYIIIIL